MRRYTSLIVIVGLVLSGALVGSATAQDGSQSTTIADTQDRTTAVIELVELSRQQPIHIGTGLVFGAGIGLVVGSLGMYGYWSRKL